MPRLIRFFVGTAVVMLTVVPIPAANAVEFEITTGGTQFVPTVAQISAEDGVAWVNHEVANYPVLIGNHNIVPDSVAGGLPDTKPFPTSSSLIAPGAKWSCAAGPGGPTCIGIDGQPVQLTPGRYAYMCGLHPNHMHGILVVS